MPPSTPNPVRRLARRLPAPVRRTLVRVRDATRPGTRRPAAGQGPAPAAASATPAQAPAAAREPLLEALERGAALDAAVVAHVRALAAEREHDRGQSLAESLRRRPGTRELGHLAAAIIAFDRGFAELVWSELQHVARDTWARRAPGEYVRAGLVVDRAAALDAVRGLVADDPPDLPAEAWFEVLGPIHGIGEAELAREVFAIFDRHVDADDPQWAGGVEHRDWMRRWVAVDPDSPSAPAPARRAVVGVLDYAHPAARRASANIGDHVQSIAALGHLVRHRRVRLHGPAPLLALLGDLGDRTRPELRREDVEADVEVVQVHRDASMYQRLPVGTWVLCFGWFMHALFGMRHGFPLHEGVRPVFVSFHCNKRDLLTGDAIAYLRRFGPVGCRDWTTVDLLLSLGVPAFFSGCLTTTIGTVFADAPPAPPGAPPAYVDVPANEVPDGAATYAHSHPEVRRRSFVANTRIALARLEAYRREHSRVVTSRLHCYLPLRALGAVVEFRPPNPSDLRFDGLTGIDDAAFAAMRDGLVRRLEPVFAAILDGRSEDDVYGLWRELTAADVARAQARHARPAALPPAPAELPERLAAVRASTVTTERSEQGPTGEEVHVAVLMRPGDAPAIRALAASLVDHASRPVHLWLLAVRGAADADLALHPAITVSHLAADGLDGLVPRPAAARLGALTAARLLVADALPDVDRVVLLPLPSVATGDVAEAAALDLGCHEIAAARRPGTAGISGFAVLDRAAARLRDRSEAASELRRTGHARHRFDFDAFDVDVLVLDLARMRAERFGERALAVVEAFGLNAREALHLLVGPGRADLPERWAAVPTRTPERGPGLLYWADGVKPWQPELTPERERWREYARASAPRARRTATPIES